MSKFLGLFLCAFLLAGCNEENSQSSLFGGSRNFVSSPEASTSAGASSSGTKSITKISNSPKKMIAYKDRDSDGVLESRETYFYMEYDSYLDANATTVEVLNKDTGKWDLTFGYEPVRFDYKNRPVEFENYSLVAGVRTVSRAEEVSFDSSYESTRKGFQMKDGKRVLDFISTENWMPNYSSGSAYRFYISTYAVNELGKRGKMLSTFRRSLDLDGDEVENETRWMQPSGEMELISKYGADYKTAGSTKLLMGEETKTQDWEKTVLHEYHSNGLDKRDVITMVYLKPERKVISFVGTFAYSTSATGNVFRTMTVTKENETAVQQVRKVELDSNGRALRIEIDGSITNLEGIADGKIDAVTEYTY